MFYELWARCVCERSCVVWGVNGAHWCKWACRAFLLPHLCNTKVCYSLSPSFSPSVLLPFLVLEGIRQQVAKNTKNSTDDFTIQAQKQIWHKRNTHTPLWYRTIFNILDDTYYKQRIACLFRQTRECIFESYNRCKLIVFDLI